MRVRRQPFREDVRLLEIAIDPQDNDTLFLANTRAKVMIPYGDVFSAWSHPRRPGKAQSPIVIFEDSGMQDRRLGEGHVQPIASFL